MTETQNILAHEDMMQAIINYQGHTRMSQGWFDILFTHRKRIALHDPKLMHKLIYANGQTKLVANEIAKTFVRENDKTLDIMYEQIGKGISGMVLLSHENRMAFIEDLGKLAEKYGI